MNRNILLSIDWVTVLLYFSIISFGMLNLYSATYGENFQNISFFLSPIGKQFIFLLISLASGIFLLVIDPKTLEPFSNFAYFISIVLLIGLFLFGKTVNLSTSWYSIGPISLQPSEFAKIGTILVLGNYLSNIQTDIKKTSSQLKIIALLAIPVFLISFQPDLGSAIIFIAFFFPLFREGLSYIYLIVFVSATLLFLITISFETIITITIIFLLSIIIYFFLRYINSKIKIWPLIIFTMS